MSTLFRPTGPLPPGVYWLRRVIALALVLVLLLIVYWVWGAVSGGGGGTAAPTTSSTGSTSSSVSSSHSSPASSHPASSHPASSHTASATGTAHSSKSASSSTSHSSTPSKSATSSPTTSSSTAAKPCADKVISVTVSTDAKSYPADVQPRLAMSIRNTGSTACVRDVGQAALELRITTKNGSPTWSSDDCAPGGPHALITLQPNQVFRTAVVWSRVTTKPGCPSGQPKAASGSYLLVGRDLKVTSASASFDLL